MVLPMFLRLLRRGVGERAPGGLAGSINQNMPKEKVEAAAQR